MLLAVYSPLFNVMSTASLTALDHIRDVMLVWRKGNIEKKLYPCYSIVYTVLL